MRSGLHARALPTALAVAAVLVAGTGCSELSSAHNLVSNAGTLSSMAKKVTTAQKLTFQATYAITGAKGTSVTVVQRPPESAFITAAERLITTKHYTYLCDTGPGRARCQRTVVSDPNIDTGATLGVAGFVSGALALGVLSAAMIVPKAHVVKSTATIAGQQTSCVTVSGLDKIQGGSGSTSDGTVSNFAVCITAQGVLAKFSGNLTDGQKGHVLLTRYSSTADTSLLKPPAGAEITS